MEINFLIEILSRYVYLRFLNLVKRDIKHTIGQAVDPAMCLGQIIFLISREYINKTSFNQWNFSLFRKIE